MTNPTPHDTLNTLFGLLGDTEVWPKEINIKQHDTYTHLRIGIKGAWFGFDSDGEDSPWWSYALAIVTQRVEGWLIDEHGWDMWRAGGLTKYRSGVAGRQYDFTAAVRHQLAKEVGNGQ